MSRGRRERLRGGVRAEVAYAAFLACRALAAVHAGDMARAGSAHHELSYCLHRVGELLARVL